jgi:hypothetical protein
MRRSAVEREQRSYKLITSNVPSGQNCLASGFAANAMFGLRHVRLVLVAGSNLFYRLLGGVAFKVIRTNFLLSEAHAAKQ